MEPVTSEIPIAAVCALGPEFAAVGTNETVTLLDELVPAGNPEPVTRINCTAGWPALGEVVDANFTCPRVVEAARRNSSGTTLKNRQGVRPKAARGIVHRPCSPNLMLNMRSPISLARSRLTLG